ncbi:hypothetical protein BEWA_029930 [Theileria equi strain WA]|uniref:Uncharacterized protein n=1 Tax=Theileria equi strain WA TaxID=1537102 RepID=L0AYP5_THEEQ|nr:hypothetical protein BEWA_029930 [Theileria equi strain WA]AFZ80141.1 hypothetical protein BEWA_029930 [Theileria equi strain WA]|eukprot:XP_004829807.1 hypothetical protein BEWA_029930 [Theileria equi strain WA]
MSAGVLTLNVDGKCGKECNCTGGQSIAKLKVSKEPDTPVKGFTKCMHYLEGGSTFKLNKTLAGDGGTISATVGSPDAPIPNVTEVSIYYWDGAPDRPILIGITKKSSSGKPTFYGKNGTGGHLSWLAGQVRDLEEQQALDKQNCYNNDAIPFNIKDSRTGDFEESKTTCMQKSRKIKSTTSLPDPPPGSEYAVTSFRITDTSGKDKETKISRVTYRSKPTDIPPISEAIEKIRLYSYPGSSQVPLMIEFKPPGNGGSKWYYSANPMVLTG